MNPTAPAPYKPDRVIGGFIIAASILMGLLVWLFEAGPKILPNGGMENRPVWEFLSPVAMMAVGPFMAPGIIAGIGIYLDRKWGFWTAIVLCLIPIGTSCMSFACNQMELVPDTKPWSVGQVLLQLASLIPAFALFSYCERRLRGLLGPPVM